MTNILQKEFSWRRVFIATFTLLGIIILVFLLYLIIDNYLVINKWKNEEIAKKIPYPLPESRPLLIFRTSPNGYLDQVYDFWILNSKGEKEKVTNNAKFWNNYGPKQIKPYDYQKTYFLKSFTDLSKIKNPKLSYIDKQTRYGVISIIDDSKKDIYLFDLFSRKYRLLLTIEGDSCSSIIAWNPDKHEIYASSEYEFSSEKYTSEYCVIDDSTGKIDIIPLLKDSPYRFGDLKNTLFDNKSNRLITYFENYLTKEQGAFLVDFNSKSTNKIVIEGEKIFSIQWSSFTDGRVLFKNVKESVYYIFNLRNLSTEKSIPIPTNYRKEVTPMVNVSPKYNYLLFSESARNFCFGVYDIKKEKYLDHLCSGKIWVDGFHAIFLGWIE